MILTTSSAAWSALFLAVLAVQQPRDAKLDATLEPAAISGRVWDVDAQRPSRRTVVTLWGDALPLGRSTVPDDTGADSIESIPPGRKCSAFYRRLQFYLQA
jgi:hypothetical protein